MSTEAGFKALILAHMIGHSLYEKPTFTTQEFGAAMTAVYQRGWITFPGGGTIELTPAGVTAFEHRWTQKRFHELRALLEARGPEKRNGEP